MSEINDGKELGEAFGWLQEYNRLKEQIKDLTERADIARAHIENTLGEATLGTVNGVPVVRWSFVESTRFDQKKAKELLSDEGYKQCCTTSTSRRFTPISQDDE